jgi:2-methylaconitate cis-trans-isomerase PrpF
VPLDEQAERATAQADLDMGVASKSTIASKLGYDYETEQQHLAEETAAQEGDESALPTQDEADVLKTTFEAGKAAIDMGMPFDLFAKKYLGWTDAEIAQVVEAAEAEEEANALEARERMDAMREGGLIGQQQQPGQPGQDEGATNQGVDGRPDGVLA